MDSSESSRASLRSSAIVVVLVMVGGQERSKEAEWEGKNAGK